MCRLALFAGLGLQIAAALQAATLVTAKTNISLTPSGGSFAPVFGPDGGYLIFQSYANNLVTNDSEGAYLDLFLHEFATAQTRLISTGPQGPAGATASAGYPSISSNGIFVAFSTPAALATNDTNLLKDVYLRDVVRGTNLPLTASSLQTTGYHRPLLSADASRIVFESTDQNLLLRELGQSTNTALRVGLPMHSPRDRSLPKPSITPDARRVAFLGTNFDLSAFRDSRYRAIDVFVRDTEAQITHWVSTKVTNISFNLEYYCLNPVISADGNVVVYKATTGGTNAWVFRYDLRTSQSTLLRPFPFTDSSPHSPSDTTPAVSADGRFVAYEWNAQIFLFDAEAATNRLVSAQPSGQPGTGTSIRPVLSPDGTMIAFQSTAGNLVNPPVPGTRFQLYVKDLVSGTTRLASFNTNGQPSLAGVRDAVPSLSPDGLRVAFDYDGSDLVAGDHNGESDVFVYDCNANSVTLISRRHADLPSSTGSWGVSGELSMSADGRLLAYGAYDDLSVTGDSNRGRDAFLADLATRQMTPLLARSNQFSQAQLIQPILSANGEAALLIEITREGIGVEEGFVHRLFWRNLLSGAVQEVDPNARLSDGNVYRGTIPAVIGRAGSLVAYQISDSFNQFCLLRDMPSGSPRPAVTNRFGSTPFGVISPMLSPDERWFTFQYNGTGLTTDPVRTEAGKYLLYARDLRSNVNYLVSETNVLSNTGITRSFNSAGDLMAYDALNLVVASFGSGLIYSEVRFFDFNTLQRSLICSNCGSPSLSADGRIVAYTSWRNTGYPNGDIYVYDRIGGMRALVSVSHVAQRAANASSDNPIVSANGRYVVFTSKATDLVPNDTNRAQDLFVRDRFRGVTYLLNTSETGVLPDGSSRRPVVSSDGLTLAFHSYASNLVPGDYNHALDIFVVRLGTGDSDSDGLDDAWEITYFDDLTRNGAGDADTDGQTDLQEFMSGTDPTGASSRLEVISIQSLAGSVTLLWTAVVGKDYAVQMKPSLHGGAWQNLSPPVRAVSSQMNWSYTPAASAAYYRIALVQ